MILKHDKQFKKGIIPWNKGKKGVQVAWNKGKTGVYKNPLKGKKMPEEWKAKLRKPKKNPRKLSTQEKLAISERMKLMTGEKNSRWKGGFKTKHSRIRKQRIREAEGSHTIGEWELLKKQYGNICPCCKKPEPEIKLTEDHIIPLSKGGSNFIENIQPLCLRCNTKKFTRIIKY